ncbi:MAG TPA: transketolase C-terminal domain-containing protein, partial [Candidatus Deferrimicrobium sp.]|nr:transketolase C-terminal domain-containing protein [Candidatus Deferrimicrobium sp.]
MTTLAPMRPAYGDALVALGRDREDVVVLSADVSNSDFSFRFAEAFPERFINVGIAEQSLVDVAVGVALTGKVAIANTFAFLFATRALEMVRTHLCYGGVPVKLMGAYGGVSDSFDGPTHHAITDIAILRSLPGMTIVVPADTTAVAKLLPQVAAWPGPVYMRLNRNEVPVLFGDDYAPQIGKAIVIRPGSDVTLVGTGLMLSRCLEAAEMLAGEGLDARVVEVHTIKPFDSDTIITAARETGALVTAEEHSIIGGLGGAVIEALAGTWPVPVERVGIADRFATTGPYDELLALLGLGVVDVVAAARRAVDLK